SFTFRHGLGVAVLEGVVYAVGGHDGWSYLNTVERWNGRAKSWSPVAPMAVQRSTVGVAALDGLLYAVGGRDGTACLRTVERFNPHTQHWCFIAPMLHRRGGVGVGAVGGRLYAVGGHNAPPSQPHSLRTASVEVYEPETDMWSEVACLSSPRDSIAVTTLGTRLYALGGHDGQVYTDRVQVFDPEANEWSDVSMASPKSTSVCVKHGLGVAVLEGVVYAVGGHDGWSYLNTVERWNGRAKSWSPVAPMAVQRSTVGVAALDGRVSLTSFEWITDVLKLYAVGGRDGTACLRTVERFNPHTQHWCFIAPMLHRRGGVGVGAVGGRLYAVGGHNAPPSQPHSLRTASVEVYEPETDMWSEVACLSSPRDSIAVTTLGTRLYALGGHDGQVYTDRVQVFDPEANEWSDIAPLPSGRAGIAVASSSAFASYNQSLGRLPYYRADPLA
ncbi:hypothetical protein AHF37_08413, partial [Paragonimus kellicotti]